MNVQYHPKARVEIDEILRHYADEDLELAVSFLDFLESAVSRIERNPDLYRKIDDLYRKCHLKRFPYSVVYWIDPETDLLVVVAIAHDGRRPKYWRGRW